jgi:hypothetical protein
VLDALSNPDIWPTVANAIVAIYGTVTLIAGRRALKTAHRERGASRPVASSRVQPCPSTSEVPTSHDRTGPQVVAEVVSSPVQAASVRVVSITYAVAEFVEQLRDRGGGDYEYHWLVAEFELYGRRKGWAMGKFKTNSILAELGTHGAVEKYRRSDGKKTIMYQVQGRSTPDLKSRPYALPAGVPDSIEKPRRKRA